MNAPERIHCRWNAADAADAFYNAGVELNGFYRTQVPGDHIIEVLSKRKGIFRLLGNVATTNEEVILKILQVLQEHNEVTVESTFGPEFEGEYEVADKPAPFLTIHGDLFFDLSKITS